MEQRGNGITAEGRRRAGRALAALGLLLALGAAAPARAANLFIQVLTPAVTLAPTPADYDRDYVEATGVSGISVRIKTNDPVGMVVLVRCADPSPQIALADLLVRTPTPTGIGGSAMSSYTPLAATDQLLWSSGIALAPFFTVTTDLRVRNLTNYNDAAGAGATNYTDTLVYTVVAQ